MGANQANAEEIPIWGCGVVDSCSKEAFIESYEVNIAGYLMCELHRLTSGWDLDFGNIFADLL